MKNYKNRDWLYKKYITEDMYMREIADLCGITTNTIKYWIRKFNIPIRTMKAIGVKMSEETRKKIGQAVSKWMKQNKHLVSGERHYNWKGGRYRTSDRYIRVLLPEHPHADVNGYVLAHRVIAESALGRPLKRNEVIHHINGDKLDNRHENLLICTMKYHQSFHHKMSLLYMQEHFG